MWTSPLLFTPKGEGTSTSPDRTLFFKDFVNMLTPAGMPVSPSHPSHLHQCLDQGIQPDPQHLLGKSIQAGLIPGEVKGPVRMGQALSGSELRGGRGGLQFIKRTQRILSRCGRSVGGISSRR